MAEDQVSDEQFEGCIEWLRMEAEDRQDFHGTINDIEVYVRQQREQAVREIVEDLRAHIDSNTSEMLYGGLADRYETGRHRKEG